MLVHRTQDFCRKLYLLLFLFNPIEYVKLLIQTRREKYDLIIYNNLFPYLSPSVLFVGKCKKVYRSHNFRSFCINGLFFKKNQYCEACLNFGFKGVVDSCYKNSVVASMIMKLYTLVLNHLLKKFGIYIACINPKMADLYIGKGFKTFLEANEVFTSKELRWNPIHDRLALFSRLSSEKGVLEVVIQCALENVPLDVYGSGPLEKEVLFWCGQESSVKFKGLARSEDVEMLMADYKAIIVNSSVLEGFPVMLAKCVALQIPAIISNTINARSMLKFEENLLVYDLRDRYSIKEIWSDKLSSNDFRRYGKQEVLAKYRNINYLV
jgi:glycosyltransferase involved in cell wall biosynthesis